MKQNAANVNAMLLCQEQMTLTPNARVASLAAKCRLQRGGNCTPSTNSVIDFCVAHVLLVSFLYKRMNTCDKRRSEPDMFFLTLQTISMHLEYGNIVWYRYLN